MSRIRTTSSSPAGAEHLLRVPLERLHKHPFNPNRMSALALAKLTNNIMKEGLYPPLIVRPHPQLLGEFQLLDGEHRKEAIKRCGHAEALCFLWPCDDATALTLVATLNRLEGEDVPARRADLLAELTGLITPNDLAQLLPDDATTLSETLAGVTDGRGLLTELMAASHQLHAKAFRHLSFTLSPDDEVDVENAVAVAIAASGRNGSEQRGHALGLIARYYLEGQASG